MLYSSTQPSTAFSLLSLTKALAVMDDLVAQGNAHWEAESGSAEQAELLSCYERIRQALPLVSTLQAWASETAEPLNKVLAEHGFSIQLQPWPNDGMSIGIVAINDFTVAWPVTGKTGHQIKDKPAFALGCDDADIEFLESRYTSQLIVKIPTRTDETVFITKSNQTVSGFALLETIERIHGTMVSTMHEELTFYEGVIIPMVKLEVQPDMSWLVGLQATNDVDRWTIVQALQEIKLGLNQHGARVKDATAIAATKSMPRYYEVDGPFLIWIEKKGVPVPTLMAYVSEQDFRDPGDLSQM